MKIDWKPIDGAEEMSPLALNEIPLSTERHSPTDPAYTSDPLPRMSRSLARPVKKTSLSNLGKVK